MKVILWVILLFAAVATFASNVHLGVFEALLGFREVPKRLPQIIREEIAESLSGNDPMKEVSTPDPLRLFRSPAPSSSLSVEGVWQWTNAHRREAGLAPLERNFLLDQVAAAKAQDMFALQYFAHVSPLGVGIGDVVESASYEFITIGENLALGNYASDQALVQAWMDSPGHRANILGGSYAQIGIALRQGMFEGSATWLAVQVFAKPLSACDVPEENLKQAIGAGQARLAELALQLERLRAEIEAYRPKFGPNYNRKVAEYNALAEEYNYSAAELEVEITRYNTQVHAFNECAKT